MSQAGIIAVTNSILPPQVPESFTTDINDTAIQPGDIPAAAGTSTATAHILRLSGDNGIKTVSTPTAAGNNVTFRFIRGSNSTNGAATANLITQAVLTDSTMTIQIIVAGFSADGFGIGAYGTAVVKNVAGVASLVNTVDLIVNADAALAACNVTVTTAGGNLLVNVLGAAGKIITWGSCLPGIVVSDQ